VSEYMNKKKARLITR